MKNKFIVACAGSGKTTTIINSVLSSKSTKKILITTFTDENCEEIKRKFISEKGYIPSNVDVLPWFTFEIRHLIKPYLHPVVEDNVNGVHFVTSQLAPYISQTKKQHYVDTDNKVYSDKIALLAYKTICDEQNVLKRLAAIYEEIYIDEFQDFVGYDLDIVKKIMESGFKVLIVGDPRQKTYSTHFSQRNKKYVNDKESFIKNECSTICEIDTTSLNGSYRCSQKVIAYASRLFPQYQSSSSKKESDDNDCIYLVCNSEINSFMSANEPVIILRNDAKTKVAVLSQVFTFGKSKGSTFENVLIYPTQDIKKAILNSDFSKITSPITLSKLYVALTRAKHKVGIVVQDSEIKKNKDSSIMVWNDSPTE